MQTSPVAASGSKSLVPVFVGNLGGVNQQLCTARDLYSFLGARRDFSNWAKDRIVNTRLRAGKDYSPILADRSDGKPGRRRTDYHLTLYTAQHVALMENNEVGDSVRDYFIDCERQLIASRQAAPQLPTPYTRNQTDVLTDGQAGLLRNMLAEAVKQLPPEMQGPAMVQGWSKLKSHFRVSYRKIPQAELTEAVSILARHIAEMLAKTLPALPPPRDDEARYFEIVGRMAAEKTTITLPMLVATTKVMAKIEGPDSASARFVQTHERLTQAKK